MSLFTSSFKRLATIRYLKIYLVLMTLPIILLGIVNAVVDPFNIFDTHFFKTYQANERYVKIKHLIEQPQYDALLVGSSRIGTTSPAVLNQYMPETKAYNLTVAGGTVQDAKLMLGYLIEHQPIKVVYWQIDLTDMYSLDYQSSDYSVRHHPLVLNTNRWQYTFDYLTVLPINNLIGKIKNHYNQVPSMTYDFKGTGRWYVEHLEQAIAQNPEQYIKNQATFQDLNFNRSKKATKIKAALAAIAQVKAICDAKKVTLITFITPHNHRMLNGFELESYQSFLNGLAQITPFWNFATYNTYTLDDHHYYESSHYRETMAKLIAARIFDDPHVKIPNDFGYYVTKTNIETHLSLVEQNFNSHDSLIAPQLAKNN